MSDVVFTICGGSDAPRGRRREVVVNGRRVKTVDIHAHCAVPEANALMGRKVEAETLLQSKMADRLRAMDEGSPKDGCPAHAAKDTDGDGFKDTFLTVVVTPWLVKLSEP